MSRLACAIIILGLVLTGCEPDRSALVGDAVVASIDYEVESICGFPFPVQFNPTVNFDEEDSYLWDFGDGNQSSEKRPFHEYLAEGAYDVSLTVGNSTRTIVLELYQQELEPEMVVRTTPVSPFQELLIENKSLAYDSAYWEYSVGGASFGVIYTQNFRFLVFSLVPIDVTLVLLCESGGQARLTKTIEISPHSTSHITINYVRYLPRFQNRAYVEFVVNGEVAGKSQQKTNEALPLEWNLPQDMGEGTNVLPASRNDVNIEIRLFIEEKLAETYVLDTKFIREYQPARLGFPYDPYFDTFNVALSYENN